VHAMMTVDSLNSSGWTMTPNVWPSGTSRVSAMLQREGGMEGGRQEERGRREERGREGGGRKEGR